MQGIDYAYTLQGWLKGINGSNGYIAYDMGLDAWAAARDAYGYTLHYFGDDYNPINYNTRPFAEYRYNMLSLYPSDYRELYNGNISATTSSIPSRYLNQLYNYEYDQLNRLVGMDMYRGLGADNKWTSLAKSDLYKERYSYDGNGNIKTVLRNGHLSANPLMDSLTYVYTAGTNRLDHIRDRNAGSTTHSNNYNVNVDIKDQVAGNYAYDAIGNVKSAKWMGDDTIRWNIYGKVTEVVKRSLAGVTSRFMHYYYDPSGNRVGQAIQHNTGPSAYFNYLWYVRDAQGNVLAVYRLNNAAGPSSGSLKLAEHYIYGSSRLGVINRDQDVDEDKLTAVGETNLGDTYLLNFARGQKLFELTNHLGNVMVTVTDKKLGVPLSGNPTVIEYWNPELITSADYYPFGMIMQGRNAYASTKYRYGYNGKEMENEVQAAGNFLDYGNRLYDPLAGRFWSVDPLTRDYAFLTPYQYASNRPIDGIDLDGLEYLKTIPKWEKSGGAFDYVSAVNNGVINLLNLPITTWNSAVKNVQELDKGTWKATVSGELQQMGSGIANTAKQFYHAPITTLTSPDAFEFYTEAFITGKAFSLTPKAGNLLKSINSTLLTPIESTSQKLLPNSTSKVPEATQKVADAAKGTHGSGTFIVSESGTTISTSQARMLESFDNAGFLRQPTQSPGYMYTLPDGRIVRAMQPSGQAPLRASFENSKGAPVNIDGKTVNPPKGSTGTKQYVRDRTHVNQTN